MNYTSQAARTHAAALQLADSILMDVLGIDRLAALLLEETERINGQDGTWRTYISTPRTGSNTALAGRNKRIIFNTLKMARLI